MTSSWNISAVSSVNKRFRGTDSSRRLTLSGKRHFDKNVLGFYDEILF